MNPIRPARILFIVTAFHFATHLYWILLQPLNTELKTFFGLVLDADVTFFMSIFLAVYAASNFLSGQLTSRLGPAYLLGAGIVLNGLAFCAMGLLGPGDYAGMCLLIALGAAGGGVYHPTASALLAEVYPGRRGFAMGVSGIGASLAFVLGPVLSSLLVPKHLTWQQVAVSAGVLGALIGVTGFLLPRTPARAPRVAGDRPAEGEPRLAHLILFTGLMALVLAGREMVTWGGNIITRQYADAAFGGAVSAGFLLCVQNLPGLFIQPLAGLWSDKVGRERLMSVTLAALALSVVILPLLPGGQVWIAYLLMGACMSASVAPGEALMADRTPARLRGAIFGGLITTGLAIGSLGPGLAGYVSDLGGRTPLAYRHAFWTLAATAVASSLLALLLRPAARRLGLPGSEDRRPLLK
jgi:MFS family permease